MRYARGKPAWSIAVENVERSRVYGFPVDAKSVEGAWMGRETVHRQSQQTDET